MTDKPIMAIGQGVPAPVEHSLTFPLGFPDAFRACFERSSTIGVWATPAEAQNLLDALELRDFWGQMAECVEAHHSPTMVPMTAQQRRYAFMSGVLHHLFEPQVADGQTATMRNKQRVRIARAARVLAKELQSDKSDLLTQFMFRLIGERRKDVVYVCAKRGNQSGIFKDERERSHMYILRLPRELRELADFAENALVRAKPHEPANPGARNGHLYQRALGLWRNFLTWTGEDQKQWTEKLLFVATGEDTCRLMEKVERRNPPPKIT